MASVISLYLRVRVRELFPLDDPVVPSLLRLMAAVDDLRTLQMIWLHAASREATTRSERAIIKGETRYLFRLTCATLYEAGLAFQDFREKLEQAGRLADVDRLGAEGRVAFHGLANAFQEGFEMSEWGKILVRLRNSAFHYEQPKVFRAELADSAEIGDLVAGEIAGASRFPLVDDLQGRITQRPLGNDLENELMGLMKTVPRLVGYLREFVDHWLVLQSDLHKSAIVERVEDTVDMDHLWKISNRKRHGY